MIKINSLLNRIKTEENINNNRSNLKTFFLPYTQTFAELKRKYELVNHNFEFCYSGEELLIESLPNENTIELIESQGYSESTLEDYPYEDYNCIHKITNNVFFKSNLQKNKINFFNGIEEIQLDYLFEDNTLIFYNGTKVYFEYTLPGEILDLVILNDFVYLLIKQKDYTFLYLTSLAHDLNKIETSNFFKIKTEYEFDFFTGINNDKIYLFNKKSKINYELKLGKKYYFITEEKLYFKFEKKYSQFALQVHNLEFLFLYDCLHLFGLTDYKNKEGIHYYNSNNVTSKNSIFVNKLDDTINGLINYNKKDLSTKQNNYFQLIGNLNLPEKENKLFTVQITKTKEKIFITLLEENKALKTLIFSVEEPIYFFGLKLNWLIKTELDFNFSFQLKNNNLNYNKKIISVSKIKNNTNSYFNKINNNFIKKTDKKLLSSFQLEKDKIKQLSFLQSNKTKYFKEVKVLTEELNNKFDFYEQEKEYNLVINKKKKNYLKLKKHTFSLRIE